MERPERGRLAGWRTYWHLHPAVRTGSELTFGERAADAMRNGMGSWTFVGLFLLFMAGWAAVNVWVLRARAFDPYPFILLNLMLSTMAGLQAAALLIAARRADAIASQIALHTEKTADETKALLEQNTQLTEQVRLLTEQVHRIVTDEVRQEGTGETLKG